MLFSFKLNVKMKRSNVLTSQRTFERRVKARLELIQKMEGVYISNTDLLNNAADTVFGQEEDVVIHTESDDANLNDARNADDNVCCSEFSDCSEDEDDVSMQNDENLEMKLWRWAIQRKISLSALSELLKILRPYVNEPIHIDGRTLLKTPSKIAIETTYSGKFWQSGLRDNLLLLSKHKKCPNTLKLMISIDGVKPYKSSEEEFWPIQCAVDGVDMEPFFTRIWYGEGKPPLEDFLRPFVNELLMLLEDGLTCNETGREFEIVVFLFICDAPARAYVKCIKGHSGYFSCERCTTEGEYLADHVCLVQTNASLRNNFSFRSREQSEHHWSTSPLEELPIDMVGSFTLDYMHLILLGVMKTLITIWTKGTATYSTKFSALDIRQISAKMLRARNTQPSDIPRKIRPLSCFGFWKATEFRTFLLKTGPVVLEGHLIAEAFNHFLLLHSAITILTSKSLVQYANVAKLLLQQFVDRFGEIYGNERYTYNIHSLIHIVDDVQKYGVLDAHSAFRYETNLGILKSLIRSGHKPLEQIAKRLLERQYMQLFVTESPKNVPYVTNCRNMESFQIYGKLCFQNTYMDSSDRNCWMLSRDEDIVKVKYFTKGANGILIHGHILEKKHKKSLYEKPLASEKLCIYKCRSNTSAIPDIILKISDFKYKMFQIQLNDYESAFFPMYHTEK